MKSTAAALVALSLALPAAHAAPLEAYSQVSIGSRDFVDLSRADGDLGKRAAAKYGWSDGTKLADAGVTGVSAMMISVVDDDHILIFDKQENNAFKAQNGKSAWGSLYTISNQKLRPLNPVTNTFCAGGGWLSNGTFVSTGGNGDGYQALRMFNPCGNGNCDVQVDKNIHLTSNRWYPSTTRLTDGSLIIMGGSKVGGFTSNAKVNNPTLEYFPPKGNGLAITSQFLTDALNTALFPVMYTLPDNRVFVAANRLAMIYDTARNTEQRLPGLPNGVRINYPATASSVLLPMTIANNWTPTIMFCGGTTANVDGNPSAISSQYPASTQCSSMTLTAAGIAKGWVIGDALPGPRLMGDAILTPDGKVFIVNGAQTGVAGYGNVKNQVGASNADNPAYQPCLYDPLAPAGQRFSTNFPASKRERLYHSSATLLPDGRIAVMGSNPNADVTTRKWATGYNVEMFSPPYVLGARPAFSKAPPANLNYGQRVKIAATFPAGTKSVTAVIMDLGFSTHAVHMNHRLVELQVSGVSSTGLTVTGPANAGIYQPGYAWIYILANGVPSRGVRIMIGGGVQPPVSQSAIRNLRTSTQAQGVTPMSSSDFTGPAGSEGAPDDGAQI